MKTVRLLFLFINVEPARTLKGIIGTWLFQYHDALLQAITPCDAS